MRLFKLFVIVAAVLFAGSAYAQQTGFYMGGAFGNTTIDDDYRYRDLGLYMDDDDQGSQLFLGIDYNRYFGMEMTYADLGEFTDSTRTFTDKFSVVAFTVVGKLPVGRSPVSYYGKVGLGVVYWEEEDRFFNINWDDSGGALAIGFGMLITPMRDSYITFRLGWDFYSFDLEDDYFPRRDYYQTLGMGSLGMQFNF